MKGYLLNRIENLQIFSAPYHEQITILENYIAQLEKELLELKTIKVVV